MGICEYCTKVVRKERKGNYVLEEFRCWEISGGAIRGEGRDWEGGKMEGASIRKRCYMMLIKGNSEGCDWGVMCV